MRFSVFPCSCSATFPLCRRALSSTISYSAMPKKTKKKLICPDFLSGFANALAQGRWFERREVCALAGGSFSSNCRLANIVSVNWQFPSTALFQHGLEPAVGMKSMGPTFSFLTAALITSFRRNFIRTNNSKSPSELWPGWLSILGSNC